MTHRRTFIRNSGLLALAIPLSHSSLFNLNSKKLSAFGIQLYMVRDEMKNKRDTSGTMKALGEMGYTQIESYGGSKGIFWE